MVMKLALLAALASVAACHSPPDARVVCRARDGSEIRSSVQYAWVYQTRGNAYWSGSSSFSPRPGDECSITYDAVQP